MKAGLPAPRPYLLTKSCLTKAKWCAPRLKILFYSVGVGALDDPSHVRAYNTATHRGTKFNSVGATIGRPRYVRTTPRGYSLWHNIQFGRGDSRIARAMFAPHKTAIINDCIGRGRRHDDPAGKPAFMDRHKAVDRQGEATSFLCAGDP